MTFSHAIFWNHALLTLSFFALGMGFVSFWVRKTPWLWGAFLLIAYILAFQTCTVSSLSLVPICTLFICHFFLRNELSKGTRLLLFGIATVVSVALYAHLLPGFHNWSIFSKEQLSPDSYPYSLYLNFDKPFIGIFVLAFSLPLFSSREQWGKLLKVGLPLSVVAIGVMMIMTLSLGIVKWDPKIPTFFFVWAISNLLFVTIPEEAFFRGFVQTELAKCFGNSGIANCFSILITSLFFTLLHLPWVADAPFLSLVFIASVIYGGIYTFTKSIECSILCHFGLNLTHFLLFSYPMLMKS